MRSEAIYTSTALAGLDSSAIAKFSEPPIRRRPLRILYIRDPTFAALDPIFALLHLVAGKVDMKTSVAAAQTTIGDFDAVVMTFRFSEAAAAAIEALCVAVTKRQPSTPIPILCLIEKGALAGQFRTNVRVEALPCNAAAIDRFLGTVANDRSMIAA
jgi:hypothetical protein